jgi:hypothetical protein
MGDEYCEEVSGDARVADTKYPVSQLDAIRGLGERTNGELEEGPGESPICVPIETAVVAWPKVSSRTEDVSITLTGIFGKRKE